MMLKAIVGAAVIVAIGVIAVKCYKESKKENIKSEEKEETLYTDKKHTCTGCKHCTCKKESKKEEDACKTESATLVDAKDDFQGCGDAGKEMDEGVNDVVEITDEISSVAESEVKEDLIDELKL